MDPAASVTRALALGVAAVLLALGGCGGAATDPMPGKVLTVTGGNLQNGCILEPLSDSLEVTLTGSDDRPVAGVPVTWQVTSGSATLSSAARPTDPEGRSRVQLTLGLALSQVAVSATAGHLPAATFSATSRVVPAGLGDTTTSALTPSSCTFQGGGPFDAYALTLSDPQSFTVSLASGAFDAALEVVDEQFTLGGAYNLDSVPGRGVTNAFLKMIATRGAYGVAAAAQSPGATGPYTLTIAAAPVSADSCLNNVWVTRGITTEQQLVATDCVDATGPYYFDTFQMILVAGQTVTITETATAFDAELFIHSSSGRVVFDDNGAGGKNARLSYTNLSGGHEQLSILASAATVGATGGYTLTLDPPAASR